MRLETADGQFVATVDPLLPLAPDDVVVWGERVFHKVGEDVWRETPPQVVTARPTS